MSSMSLPLNRKRLRSPNYREESDQSDSDKEVNSPPAKIRKTKSPRIIPLVFRQRLQQLSLWMNEWKVKGFFAMAIKNGCQLPAEITVSDDEDDEEEESDDEIKEIKPLDPEKFADQIKKMKDRIEKEKKQNEKERAKRQNGCKITSRFGTPSWNSKYGDYSSEKSRTDNVKRYAPVTNPGTDIEIMLPKTEDDIEILSEMPSTKPKHSSSKPLPSSRSSSDKSSTSGADSSNSSTVKRSQSSPKSFTCNEVMRLQEKAQYRLLLDKYINGPKYQHIVKKPDSVDAGIQTDLKDLKLSGFQFRKEILEQPIAPFIERYYKPVQLTKLNGAEEPNAKAPPEIKIDDDDDDDDDEDDELKILEVRLPKFKPVVRSRNFFSPEWLAEVKSNIIAQTEERLKIVEEHEKQLEHYRKERTLKLLSVDHDIQPVVEPEFPELTPEMEEVVEQALSPGNPNDLLSGDLLRKDFETLDQLNWLNDSVINNYMELLVARSKQVEGYPKIHAFSTFFYSTYKLKGYSSVQRWTRKIDIFSFDLSFVPIHLSVHWCLAVIDHRSKKICYYDSMGTGEEQCLDLLHDYLRLEYKNKKGAILDPSIYSKQTMKDIPQQMNGSDCGMFTIKYAECVSRDAEINFNQSHMQYFRRRTVYELAKRQLL